MNTRAGFHMLYVLESIIQGGVFFRADGAVCHGEENVILLEDVSAQQLDVTIGIFEDSCDRQIGRRPAT